MINNSAPLLVTLMVLAGCGGGIESAVAAAPTVRLTLDQHGIVAAGSSATLTWSATAPKAVCTASGAWSGSLGASGSRTVTPSNTGYYNYALSCAEPGGNAGTASVVLTAYGAPPSVTNATGVTTWNHATLNVPAPNEVTAFTTTFVVPNRPASQQPPGAYINVWPALLPDSSSANFLPINKGVLQPVVKFWQPYTDWKATATYDNIYGTMPPVIAGKRGPNKGEIDSNASFMVAPGDLIRESITLNPATGYWTVTMVDQTSGSIAATLVMNLEGQQQNIAAFALEVWRKANVGVSMTFLDSTITFAKPDTTGAICNRAAGAANNYTMTPPRLDRTRTKCGIAAVVLTSS
ncbi:hypothetical protein [Burkholderia stagnalis]